MHEVSARARTGYLLVLDQCPSCGGIWCDRWELFPLSSEEALRLDAVDENKLAATLPSPSATGTCPRCSLRLELFRDPQLPADARIERCKYCDGMWLNRGELRRVKAGSDRPSVLLPEDIEHLAERYGSEAKWATVSDLDSAMHESHDPAREADELKGEMWSATGWLALRLLLRLLLRV